MLHSHNAKLAEASEMVRRVYLHFHDSGSRDLRWNVMRRYTNAVQFERKARFCLALNKYDYFASVIVLPVSLGTPN